jgi:hypothetical protein
MRRYFALTGVLFLSLSAVQAGEHFFDGTYWSRLDCFVQRAPQPKRPVENSMARAGNPQSVRSCGAPSITCRDYGGYVGGARVCGNNVCSYGPGSATGPIRDGVFATDYAGLRCNLGRLFLAASADPSCGKPIFLGYQAEGPRVTDIFAIRPLRKACLEKREDMEKRAHCAEHGEGAHGAENGHGPEGGKKEPGHE